MIVLTHSCRENGVELAKLSALSSIKDLLKKFAAQVEIPLVRVQRNVSLNEVGWLRDSPRSGYHLQSLKNMEDILSAVQGWCVFRKLTSEL